MLGSIGDYEIKTGSDGSTMFLIPKKAEQKNEKNAAKSAAKNSANQQRNVQKTAQKTGRGGKKQNKPVAREKRKGR